MTYKALTLTNRIKCAVVISGLADLIRTEKLQNNLSEAFKVQFGTDNPHLFEERKIERSPVHFADKIKKNVSVLLIHGKADTHVAAQDSVDMFNLLKENNVYTELRLIQGGDHYLTKQKKETAVMRRRWFDKYLKNTTQV